MKNIEAFKLIEILRKELAEKKATYVNNITDKEILYYIIKNTHISLFSDEEVLDEYKKIIAFFEGNNFEQIDALENNTIGYDFDGYEIEIDLENDTIIFIDDRGDFSSCSINYKEFLGTLITTNLCKLAFFKNLKI